MTTAKAKVAAIGSTLAALVTFTTVLSTSLADNHLDASDYGTLSTAAVIAVGTIYGVWRTPNKPKDGNAVQSR